MRNLGETEKFHGSQLHDACTVPAIILQRKLQTNVEKFHFNSKT